MGRTCGCVDGRHGLWSGLVVIPSTCAHRTRPQSVASESRFRVSRLGRVGSENVSVVLNTQVPKVPPEGTTGSVPKVPRLKVPVDPESTSAKVPVDPRKYLCQSTGSPPESTAKMYLCKK
jgi:hypothetical protein